MNQVSHTQIELSEIDRNLSKFLFPNVEIIPQSVPVGGRVKFFIQNWKVITRDPWILQSVKGIELPLVSNPYQKRIPVPSKFRAADQILIDSEIESLVSKHAVRETTPTSDSFYSNVFLVPKKGGELRPVINLRNLNGFLPYQHFKMEGIQLLRDLMEEGDWLVKLDLKDAYLTINVAEEFRKYLKFFWRNKIMEFTSLPFGIAIAPRVFTKIMKVPIAILRRLGIRLVIYLDDIMIMNQSLSGIQSDLSTAVYLLENLGFLINQKKSVLVPTHVTEFLGFTVNSETMTLSLPKDKVIKIKQNCLDLVSRQSVSARDLAQLIGRLTATNQAVLPSPLHYRSLQILKTKALHAGGSYDHQVQLDEESKQELIWWSSKLSMWNGKALVRPHPNIVIKSDASLVGWGAVCQNAKTGGLWLENERDQHINVLELKAAFLAIQCFQSKILKKTCTTTIGQQSSDSLYKQYGGYKIKEVDRSCKSDLAMVFGKGNNSDRGISTRAHEHRGGLGKPLFQGHEFLEIRSRDFQSSNEGNGPLFRRSFCGQNKCPTEQVLQLERRPSCTGIRCDATDLEEHNGLCFSPILHDIALFSEGEGGEVPSRDRNTDMANATLVSSPPSDVDRLSSADTDEHENLNSSPGGSSPFDRQRHITSSRVEGIRRYYASEGFSDQVKELLLHAWRPGTKSAYDSAWSKWNSWCLERSIDPFSAPLAAVLDFLAWMFFQGYKYRTINVHRSAISSVLPQVNGVSVGQIPVVKQLFKGILIKDPPQPKYGFSWDINVVLKHLSELPNDNDLSLLQLSKKFSTLLALGAPKRVSEIARFDRRFLERKGNSLVFHLPGLSKCQTDNTCRSVQYDKIDNEKLCVVHCCSVYEERTESFRSQPETEPDPLLRATKKPHNGVSAQTISNWIKSVMFNAGVDTSKFQAHSCRMVSSSRAHSTGIPLEEILLKADWSNARTFKTYYLRSTPSDMSYTRNVLNMVSFIFGFKHALLYLTKYLKYN